jgi:5-methylcytosine-specific restriction enzyme subunit McrC
VFVIDTKWKRVSSRIEDPKQGVSQADVYQMIAYGRLYECPHLMLLYPHHLGIGTRPLHDHYRVAGCGDTLSVATLDLAEGTARNMADLAALLLGETTDTPSPVLPQPCH